MKTLNSNPTKLFLYTLVSLSFFFFQSCSSGGDDMAEPDPGGGEEPPACDVSNVTFSKTVWPIINNNCVSCHSGSSPRGGISLDDHASVSAQAAIAAGSPGSLYGAITHNSGNTNMPQNASKLSDCNIKKIKAWIDAGRPNN